MLQPRKPSAALGIQIALVAFVIAFPTAVASLFFVVLWRRPFVFYPPSEFGPHSPVAEYVSAMLQAPPAVRSSAGTSVEALSASDLPSALISSFTARIPTAAWVVLYACSIALAAKRAFKVEDLFSDLPGTEWANAFLLTARSIGAVDFTETHGIVNVTRVNPTLAKSAAENVSQLRRELREDVRQIIERHLHGIEKYLGSMTA